jgi:apolipoprotein D and lipocalin family protein
MRPLRTLLTTALAALAGCASAPDPALPPLTLAPQVDLPRFMGDWYVIAAIPTALEKGNFNAKDSYRLDADGTIDTTYSYNADGFTGPRRTMGSRGFVLDGGRNAVWGQQYVWPIKADYRIAHVSADYTQTVIAREKRDYVWVMARTPTIPEADYQRLSALVGRLGYDVSKLQRSPQAGGG